MIIYKGCFERGCACYDKRVDSNGVQVVDVEQFLVESGQYLTNDASREAAIADAVAKERETAVSTLKNEAWNKGICPVCSTEDGQMEKLQAENAQLRERDATVEKDAKRFRWLRNHTVQTGLSLWMQEEQFLSEAVDAAMKESP